MRGVIAVVLAACVIGLLPGVAVAQQVSVGVKGGLSFGDIPNFGSTAENVEVTTSMRTGFAAGGFLNILVSGGFSIQPEVLFTQKGVEMSASAGSSTGTARLKFDFVDVPVLARYSFGKGKTKGYVFAGPSFDFKTGAKAWAESGGSTQEEDISSEVESVEYAFVFGGGVQFGRFLVEARWSEGLSDLEKNKDAESSGAMKSRTFLVLAGFRF